MKGHLNGARKVSFCPPAIHAPGVGFPSDTGQDRGQADLTEKAGTTLLFPSVSTSRHRNSSHASDEMCSPLMSSCKSLTADSVLTPRQVRMAAPCRSPRGFSFPQFLWARSPEGRCDQAVADEGSRAHQSKLGVNLTQFDEFRRHLVAQDRGS